MNATITFNKEKKNPSVVKCLVVSRLYYFEVKTLQSSLILKVVTLSK